LPCWRATTATRGSTSTSAAASLSREPHCFVCVVESSAYHKGMGKAMQSALHSAVPLPRQPHRIHVRLAQPAALLCA
jgi:hypothetical protein